MPQWAFTWVQICGKSANACTQPLTRALPFTSNNPDAYDGIRMENPMFNKTDINAAPTAPATAPARPERSTPSGKASVLGADLKITGEITSAGNIEVLGDVDGTITAQGLVVGAEGKVTGIVTAETVEVKGRLDGKVTSKTFSLRSTAAVAADVTYAAIVIESGATIEGRFTLKKA
jgi:cytoskeletal protein CcmA (bactofilin family)